MTLHIALTLPLDERFRGRVKSGRYQSACEAIREARLSAKKQAINQGLDDVSRGRMCESPL